MSETPISPLRQRMTEDIERLQTPPRLRTCLRLLEVEIQSGRDRLHLHVMVHDVDRLSQCRGAVVVGATQVDQTVFHPEADVTRHLVVDAGAYGPSTAPVVEGKAVAQRRVLSDDIDLHAGPASFAVDEPLINGKAEASSQGGDGAHLGAIGNGNLLPAAKITIKAGAAQRSFYAKHNVAKLLVVANLSAADESARVVVDAFAGEVDVLPTDIGPCTAEMAADVEPRPANEWDGGVDAHRARIPVGMRRQRIQSGRDDDCAKREDAEVHERYLSDLHYHSR
jgi:hypothetical protein